MSLIDIKPIHTQLFKGHHMVFLFFCLQFPEPYFQLPLCTFQLFDRIALATVTLHFSNAVRDIVDLILQKTFLPLLGYRDTFKLAVAKNDSIIITGSDPGTELLPVRFFEVFTGSYKDVCAGIEAKELGCPLLRQMIRHDKHGFLTQSKAFGFHHGSNHFEGFARAYFMGEKRIPAIKNVSNSIPLMLTQFDFRIHTVKGDMASVILPGPNGIEQFIIGFNQVFAAFRIFPYPVPESVLDSLLLLLGQSSLFLIQHTFFFPFRILNRVIYPDISQIQRVLQDSIGIRPVCTVSHIGRNVICRHQ